MRSGRTSLGRGLSQLISGNALAQTRAVIEVAPDRLAPNPFQPRQAYDPEMLSELAESIRQQGILQPILVRPAADDYQIVLGERRWRAAQEVGLDTIPCIVQEVDDRQALEMALVENLHREDLNCVDTARGFQQLIDEFGFTHEQLAEQIGKSRSAITNTLRLLQLPQEVQASLSEGRITEGHGRALLALADQPELLYRVWQVVEAQGLSVRETEELVAKPGTAAEAGEKPPARRPAARPPDPHLTAIADLLQDLLATEVGIRPKSATSGAIVIHYSDLEELDRILELLAPSPL